MDIDGEIDHWRQHLILLPGDDDYVDGRMTLMYKQ